MPVEPPVLLFTRIPKPDRTHLAKIVRRQPATWIRAASQRGQTHFAPARGGFERAAVVGVEQLGGGAERGGAALKGFVQNLLVGLS